MRKNIEELMELERESGIDISYFTDGLNPETDGHSDGLAAEGAVTAKENDRLKQEIEELKGKLAAAYTHHTYQHHTPSNVFPHTHTG